MPTYSSWTVSGGSIDYVPIEKPVNETVQLFNGTKQGSVPPTTNLSSNTGQYILAQDGTWIPQPSFTSGGSDAFEILRPSVFTPTYSAYTPTVTNSSYAYDVDTNHSTTFGEWEFLVQDKATSITDTLVFSSFGAKTQTWTSATINISRAYGYFNDGESSNTTTRATSVKVEFSTDNGSTWTTIVTDLSTSVPSIATTSSYTFTTTPTMGNIKVRLTVVRGGGGTIYNPLGFPKNIPGSTGDADLHIYDIWISGTYAGGAGNITCNNLTVTGDATFQNKIYDSTASAGTTGQVLKVAANGKVTWATDSAGSGTVTSITTTGANGVTISGGSTQTITTSGTFALALGNITPTSISTGTGSFSGDVEFAASIKSPNGSNSPIVISPDGTGDLHVNADSLRLGDNNADATIATNGTGDLILTTHEGSATEGVIRLYDGANGNITLTPNGTGQVQVGSDQVVTLTASQTLTNKTLSTSSVWNGNTIDVAYGGTGSTTLTSGSYVVGNGTSAVTLKTPTQVTADLDTFTYQIGATAGKKGLVPAAPAIGGSVVYLDQTGSWTTPSGGGTTTNALTISSPLTGTSFNGSTAVTIGLGSGYGDTQNPYASKTANYVLAAPDGSAGVPTFRAIVAADIPTLNQNTTGTAANVTGIVAVANGGTGLTSLTAGRIPYGSGTSAFGSSANLFWDSTNSRLGLGITTPSATLHLQGSSPYIWIYNDDETDSGIKFGDTQNTGERFQVVYDSAVAALKFVHVNDTASTLTERLRITSSGQLVLGNGDAVASPSGGTLRGTDGSGTDISGASLTIQGGRSTGTGTGGSVIFNTTAAAGTTGSSLNAVSERMRISSAGNVGIGTAFPGEKLHIEGNLYFGTTSRTIAQGGSANMVLQVNTGQFIFTSANGATERMRINASGYLGIGNTNPVSPLTVATSDGAATSNATGSNAIRMRSTATAGVGVGPSIVFEGQTGNTTATYGFAGIQGFKASATANDYSGAMAFYTQNSGGSTALTERMRLDSAGNLGIGSASPWSQLTVGSGGTANPASTVTFHKLTVNEYRLKLTSTNFNSDGSWLGLGFGYSDNYLKAAIIAECKDANARTNLHFALNNVASSANASLSDSKMVLTYSGDLGIGTTSPAYKLDVNGTLNASGALTVSGNATFDTNSLFVDATNHRVGMGTTSPINKLTILGSTAASGELGSFAITGSTTAKRLAFGVDSTATMYGWIQSVESGIGFRDIALQPLGGNLGVGTASPDAKLSVNGVGSFGAGTAALPSIAQFGDLDTGRWSPAANTLAWSTGGSERMRITSGGELLLGTSSATYGGQLTVRGSGITVASFMNSNFVAATSGTQLNVNVGATTGNTNFQLQVNSGGGLAFNDLCLQPSGGNLLIGNTTGTEKLTVTGKIKASDVLLGNNGTKGYGAITTTTSTSTPTGGSSGDFTLIY